MGVFLLLICTMSGFINNTPMVALFIPVVVQMARSANMHPGKLLIPLSFGTIFGNFTLIGTSTNVVVSGVMDKSGLGTMPMLLMLPMGLVFMAAGILYFVLAGRHLLPRYAGQQDLKEKFGMAGYLTEIELLQGSPMIGRRIMESPLVRELDMDIIEVVRNGERFTVPAGDMVLQKHDLLKVRCDVARIRALKDRAHISVEPAMRLAQGDLKARGTTLVELVITANSELEGKTLRDADLLRKYRAVPLAVRHREEVVHSGLQDTVLRSGDVVLAEVRSHYVQTLKKLCLQPDAAFAILTEQEGVAALDKRGFAIVLAVTIAVVVLSSLNVLPVMVAALLAVITIVLTRSMTMKEVHESIEWRIIFLMAGTLSLSVAMQKTGLAERAALSLVHMVGGLGPVAIVSALYILTVGLSEVMSHTATAALFTPIAIATAHSLGLSPIPFIMAVTFAASFTFMLPIGYQTHQMVYTAGQYRAVDFLRVGAPLNLLFWILATWLIPVFYPF
jgi:di/tricarboxylate transporter